jgi:hypothetical protein
MGKRFLLTGRAWLQEVRSPISERRFLVTEGLVGALFFSLLKRTGRTGETVVDSRGNEGAEGPLLRLPVAPGGREKIPGGVG